MTPGGGESGSNRPDAAQIYERVVEDAHHELARGNRALALSGLFAGFTIGVTPVAYAAAATTLDGPAATFAAGLLYPIGYVAVIVGRAQLFTENTLYPVMVALGDRRFVLPTARLWAVVLLGNLVGAMIFGLLTAFSPALPGPVAEEIVRLGVEAVDQPPAQTFWSAVLAGWSLALVAWLVAAANDTIGIIVVVWIITAVVGLTSLDHSVANAIEVWAGLFEGRLDAGPALAWEAITVLGNALGGVFIVTVLNFGQVHSSD